MILSKLVTLPLVIQKSAEAAIEITASDPASNTEVLVHTFTGLIIPAILLIFFGLIKYGVGIRRQDIQWFHFAAEIPIDLLSIFSSLLICQHFTSNNSTPLIIIACAFVLFSLIIAYLGSIFRGWFNEQLETKPPCFKPYLYLIIDYCIVIGWLLVILKFPTWIPIS